MAAAIASVAAGAVLASAIVATAHFGPDPVQSSFATAAGRELDVAQDLEKYQGVALQSRTLRTTLPLPDGSPLPATLTLTVTNVPGGGRQLTINTTTMWHGVQHARSLSTTLLAPAPLPGSSLTLSGLAPPPTGAP